MNNLKTVKYIVPILFIYLFINRDFNILIFFLIFIFWRLKFSKLEDLKKENFHIQSLILLSTVLYIPIVRLIASKIFFFNEVELERTVMNRWIISCILGYLTGLILVKKGIDPYLTIADNKKIKIISRAIIIISTILLFTISLKKI